MIINGWAVPHVLIAYGVLGLLGSGLNLFFLCLEFVADKTSRADILQYNPIIFAFVTLITVILDIIRGPWCLIVLFFQFTKEASDDEHP